MKANEAPEKIYRTTTYLDGDRGKTLWKANQVAGAENIEYTRTDAFIERAIGWIDYNNRNGGCNFNEWEKDFKNYMEGE